MTVSLPFRLALVLAVSSTLVTPASANSYKIEEVAEAYADAMEAKDYSRALKIVEPIAEDGNPSAQNWLAKMYLNGQGVTQNVQEAFRLFTLSANAGNGWSQYYLGLLMLEGMGSEIDAYNYLNMSARQGIGEAQAQLGILLSPMRQRDYPAQLGESVDSDAIRSAYWHRKAAEQGHRVGQYNLGLAYTRGLGVPLNPAEAVRWYRLAAKQGYPPAQNNLATSYSLGEGVGEDSLKAYMWYVIAAASGGDIATDNRDAVRAILTPEQRTRAEELAMRCFETEYAGCD